jgi:putative ATP-binding cassette transporter
MELLALAFGPERHRKLSFGLICLVLAIGYGFESLILGAAIHANQFGEERLDLAVALLLTSSGYAWAIVALGWRGLTNLETAALRTRRRLIATLQRRDLATMERVGPARVLHGLTAAPRLTVSIGTILLRVTEVGCFIAGTLLVMSFLAWQFLLMIGAVLVLFSIAQAANLRGVMRAHAAAAGIEARNRADLMALVGGFKELKLNADRRAAFLAALRGRMQEAQTARARADRRVVLGMLLQMSSVIGTSAFCIFLLPGITPSISTATLVAAALLMANIPLGTVRDIPVLAHVSNETAGLARLQADLGIGLTHDPRPDGDAASLLPFQTIALAGTSYRYPGQGDEAGFALAPVTLTFLAGSITFIVGGNGSGKSTLLKLLAGLYMPSGGRVLLNGAPASQATLREMSTVIFSDHHVFERLYGVPAPDPNAVNAALAAMGIAGQTRFENGRFSRIALSSGQRKRLAWVAGLQDDRPLVLLDEWAADQDPEFRDRFYRELLPALRDAGKTVIAVSHDDRYFDMADRLIRLDYGRLVAE